MEKEKVEIVSYFCPRCGKRVDKEAALCPECKKESEIQDKKLLSPLISQNKEEYQFPEVSNQKQAPRPSISIKKPPLIPTIQKTSITTTLSRPVHSRTELPMEKIFDEIFYLRNYRKTNLYIIGATFLLITGFLIWLFWSLFEVWNQYFAYYDPFWFIITGLVIGSIIGTVWLIRGRDLKRGIPYTLRPRKSFQKYRIFRRYLYHRLGLVPKSYYDPKISADEKEKDLLIWASDKRTGIGFKILLYIISALLCLGAFIAFNQYKTFFGLVLTPINISIFIILIGIFSIIPNSIRKYYCLSPVYFTQWILEKWIKRDRKDPLGLYFKPLYLNLQIISKNYLNLEVHQINEIVANIYTYFIIREEQDISGSIEIDNKLKENLDAIKAFIENYAIDHKQYLSKSKTERIQFNNDLDKTLENVFFKFLLIADDIQRFNRKQIGDVLIKFKIDWKQRLWENFSKLLFSVSVATIISIITGLLSTIL